MSATIPLPIRVPKLWATSGALALTRPLETAAHHIHKKLPPAAAVAAQPFVDPLNPKLHQMPHRQPAPLQPAVAVEPPAAELEESGISVYAFYRKHTENMLRRYLYASTQVGRSPNLLGESVGRGWVSSRKVRTFEDALIFVLDVERCLNRLPILDRHLISRILLQEYTHPETAALLRISVRTILTKLPQAIDHLTEMLVEADLLILPN